MATLSALTGNMTYLSRSRRCLERLFALRSGVDLLGKHIDTGSLRWTEVDMWEESHAGAVVLRPQQR